MTKKQREIESVLNIAKENGLRLKYEGADINETGMDFQVIFAEDDNGVTWVLRKPRRPDVIERAAAESDVLAFLLSHAAVSVPDWRIHTPELIAYPKLDGIPAAAIDLDKKQYVWNMEHEPPSDGFVGSLAAALAGLHGADPDAASRSGIEIIKPDDVRQRAAESMDHIKKEIGVSEQLWKRWQTWINDSSYWPDFSGLIHGDLHPPHILIGENQRVTGLLDWTEAKVADPAKDFVLYQVILGEKETKRLMKSYEAEGGRVWPKMQEHVTEWQAAYPVETAKFALQTGQEEHMQMARDMLGLSDPKGY
ncbi:macrolide 2'-phosphotransferase [Bacillus velezensis]|uniref:macrolide 2'-phosphotransferase n=1 Tax=Bacillus velezensis TaxID=492670 RepID=UPI0021F6BEE6|nr:macrolide 2'-phosphotransferase [Bacillus velezensis]MEC1926167.1 macrolide 2'-phosphotransferase [Bacillus velezensis]UYQ96873.1 macrolide 2'-phosphotransferase [Bacillus velezensis]WDV42473.1 macrolide 2'-phosphotransferase [Bacillus velezensis]